LQEFFVVVTKKIQKPMKISAAREIIGDLLKWEVVVNDGESILSAIDLTLRYRYSFWDAMIIDAAVKGGSTLLYSEDLQDGRSINGLLIRNPFSLC
jgi:predicted nucleic acid-binding protein